MMWWKWCLARLHSHCSVSRWKVVCAKNGVVKGLLDFGVVVSLVSGEVAKGDH